MTWRIEDTDEGKDLVWDGVELGIAPSPTKGTANIQNVNIATETGEIFPSFGRVKQTTQAPIVDGTLTASVGAGSEYLTPSASLKAGVWINISASTITRTSAPVDYVVVAGGGGGAGNSTSEGSGGGGAGGLLQGVKTVSVASYTVTVGAGGAGGTGNNDGADGSSSAFDTVTTTGGGGGAYALGPGGEAGRNGGSGGGGIGSGAGGTGISGQGFAGGAGDNTGDDTGGGGGGASEVGGNATDTVGGAGGDGISPTETSLGGPYAGGGGGGGTTGGAGGAGGGGTGGSGSANGTAGTANTGGGGGGASSTSSASRNGGDGGSGIVVISYLTGTVNATGGTITTVGDRTVHTFTSSSTFQVTSIPLAPGNYYVSIENLAGQVKISDFYDPFAENPIVHSTTGTATFSTISPVTPVKAIAKATEKYDSETATYYRYYILDDANYVWVYDTGAYASSLAASGVGTLWMLPDPTNYAPEQFSGMAVLNGWLIVASRHIMYAKPTVSLGNSFEGMNMSLANISTSTAPLPHFCYVGHQGTLYYTDGNYLGSIFPTTSLETGIGNVQSYSKYTATTATTFTIDAILSGSAPIPDNSSSVRIPVVFFTDQFGTLPSSITAGVVYYVYPQDFAAGLFEVYAAISGGSPLDIQTGASGNQYFNTFYPIASEAAWNGNNPLVEWVNQRLNLPAYETATSMTEVGTALVIGGVTNTVYSWDQVSPRPTNFIFLPETGVASMLTVNQVAYIFAGNKGNVYITDGSIASLALKVPDYCAGVPGSTSSYFEPYFEWGDSMYLRGRVYFSILDQTTAKAGNCGGIWSFYPTQNLAIGQDTGLALRLENQNSYGTYNGVATILIPNEVQLGISPLYWSAWYSSISAPTYGFDYTNTIATGVTVIETDLIPSGTFLTQKTFDHLEFKLSSLLASGDNIQLYWRLNSTDAWTSAGTLIYEVANPLSGYYNVNFQKTQWVQFRAELTPNGLSTSNIRLVQIRLR